MAPTCARSPAFIGITGSDGAGSRSGAIASGVASDRGAVTGSARASAPSVRTSDAGSFDRLPPPERPLPSSASVKMNGPMADAAAFANGATPPSTRARLQTLNRTITWAAIALPNAPPARRPR